MEIGLLISSLHDFNHRMKRVSSYVGLFSSYGGNIYIVMYIVDSDTPPILLDMGLRP